MAAKFHLKNGQLVPGERDDSEPAPGLETTVLPPLAPALPSLLGPRTLKIVNVQHKFSKAGNPMVVIAAKVVSNDWTNGVRLYGYFPYLASSLAFERLRRICALVGGADSSDPSSQRFLDKLLDLEFDAEVVPHSYETPNGTVNTFKWISECEPQRQMRARKKARREMLIRRQEAEEAEAEREREQERERERLAQLEAVMDLFVEIVRAIIRAWAEDVVDDTMLRFALLELS